MLIFLKKFRRNIHMKFTISRTLLMNSINNVSVAISNRTAIPILTGIKLEITNEGLTLTGSDSNISIESFIPTETENKINIENIIPGSIVVQAQYFPQIIRKLPENIVHIEVDHEENVSIRSGNSHFTLNGINATEYPQLPVVTDDQSFSIKIDLLKSLIRQTVFAISLMETRPILTGVQAQLLDGTLTFTATDGHRLATRKVYLEDGTTSFPSAVIPGSSLNELYKILDDQEETVKVSLTNNLILFQTDKLYFLSRLLDGKYPETSSLIPTEQQTVLHVNTQQLMQTVDRAALLASRDSNQVVKLETKESNIIEISSESLEIGDVVEKIHIIEHTGEPLQISFSAKYLQDSLKAIESDEVKISFSGSMRPFVIRPVNDDLVLQLILPVRTF